MFERSPSCPMSVISSARSSAKDTEQAFQGIPAETGHSTAVDGSCSVSQPWRRIMEDNQMPAADRLAPRSPWNKGKLVGAKLPLRVSHVWSIRTKLQIEGRKRDLALFNLAIDSKLRGCDVVAIRVDDVAPNGYAMDRATIRQKK